MDELRVDRGLNLTQTPAFLRAIEPSERAWWKPVLATALVVAAAGVLGMLGAWLAGVINFSLVNSLMLHRPLRVALLAAGDGRVHCEDCLMGGVTDGVLVGVVSAACLVAVLLGAAVVDHRSPRSWITAAPHFRWRLFFFGLGAFAILMAAVAAVPEALHGFPDRPVVWRSGESLAVHLAYLLVMLTALPVAAAFEEVLCRGWLLQTTATFTHNLLLILGLNSVIFALLHIDNDLGHNVSRAGFGMALSYGALRLGGLELGMGVHAANNLVILLLAQTLREADKTQTSSWADVVVNLAMSGALVALTELVARWEPLRRWTEAAHHRSMFERLHWRRA